MPKCHAYYTDLHAVRASTIWNALEPTPSGRWQCFPDRLAGLLFQAVQQLLSHVTLAADKCEFLTDDRCGAVVQWHPASNIISTPPLTLASSGDPERAQGCLQPQPHWRQLPADQSQGRLSRHNKEDQGSVTSEMEMCPLQLLFRDHMCPDAAAESGGVLMVCQPAV